MAIKSYALRTTVGTITTPQIRILAPATSSPRLMEIGFFLTAATASTLGLARDNGGTWTASTTQVVLAEDPADPAGLTNVQSAFSVSGTTPTLFIRRCTLPATIGVGLIWTFPRGIKIAASTGLMLWNITACSVLDCYVVVDE